MPVLDSVRGRTVLKGPLVERRVRARHKHSWAQIVTEIPEPKDEKGPDLSTWCGKLGKAS